jgi:hypothetical protein
VIPCEKEMRRYPQAKVRKVAYFAANMVEAWRTNQTESIHAIDLWKAVDAMQSKETVDVDKIRRRRYG